MKLVMDNEISNCKSLIAHVLLMANCKSSIAFRGGYCG